MWWWAGKREGYVDYERLIEGSADKEPEVEVLPKDPWILIYTSGTTGKPKGVIRSHESHIAFYLLNAVDSGFTNHDICLNVMPLCHINSTFYTFTFLYIGGTAYIHPARSFKAEEILEIIEREKITFISLIPTHYNLILNTPPEARRRNVGSIRKLLCSSAPVRKNMKLAILDFFPGVELYEAYGSTEGRDRNYIETGRSDEKARFHRIRSGRHRFCENHQRRRKRGRHWRSRGALFTRADAF